MAGIPSSSKAADLNHQGPPCHLLCECGCCPKVKSTAGFDRNEGKDCANCWSCKHIRCLVWSHYVDTPTPSPEPVLECDEIELSSDNSSLSSVDLGPSPQPACASYGCYDCKCCALKICDECPACSCANFDIMPSLDEIDDMLECPQSIEDPDMVNLIEESCQDDEDYANEAFECLPDLQRDIEMGNLGWAEPRFPSQDIDINEVDISPTFFHNDMDNSVTLCGNDPN